MQIHDPIQASFIPEKASSLKQRSDQNAYLKTVLKNMSEFGTWAQTLGS